MEIIALTDKAALHFKSALSKSNFTNPHLRIDLIPGGCAGLKYALGITDQPDTEDMVIESNGINVVIDPNQLGLLQGMVIDIEDGLEGANLKIKNPNFSHSCGCGKSVS